ncbi:MAG: ParA family protein [Planctomycetota bacterium]
MTILTSINAKGGCGKSTIAISVAAGFGEIGQRTLLIDMDPQAQITEWLDAGDPLEKSGSLASVFDGEQDLADVIRPTNLPNLDFVPSSGPLEDVGRRLASWPDYHETLARQLMDPRLEKYDYVVLDSPNQVSTVMVNAIVPTDLFIVPFKDSKAVRSYANVFGLIDHFRPDGEFKTLHVLVDVSRQPGLRNEVLAMLKADGIQTAKTEMRSCGWLARIDNHGGSIFQWRPSSRGAEDAARLITEIAGELGYAVEEPEPQNLTDDGEDDVDVSADFSKKAA